MKRRGHRARPLATGDAEMFFVLSLDMVCIADSKGYFTRVNPAFETTLGYKPDELTARPFLDFIHPEDVAATLAEVQKLAQGQPTISFQNRYRCKDGTIKWLSWRAQPAPDGTLYAVARDVTDQQHLVQELHDHEFEARAANSAKSLFLAAMSHEIRTPLIGVLGMLEVLGRSRLDAEQRRQLNIIQYSAHSLLDIIGDILDYSKIEAGKVELEPETLSIRDLVAQVVGNFSANAEAKGLRLTQVIGAGVARAHVGDGVRLAQILRNLVSNGIKFTEKGSVTVSVRVIEDAAGAQLVGFTVSDTGIGMAPEQAKRIFQPFTQADAGTTRRFGGTGLGLAICQRLAGLLGGALRLESEPGQGTVVTLEVRMPLGNPKDIAATARAEEAQIVTRPKPGREQAEREGSLLLLAEDHLVNREVLAGQLSVAGFFVDTAEDGARALERFGTASYALVFTDLHMPGLDGYELTAAIRELEAARGRPRTPIVALTADVVREHLERCLAAGMDDYLLKPVTIRQLVEKLQRWLPHVELGQAAQPAAPAARQPPGDSKPVDHGVLDRITGGDAGKTRLLLARYCQSNVEDLAALSEALGQGNDAVTRVAHRMKGAAAMVGASEVARIAGQLERLARESPEFDGAPLAAELREAASRVDTYVRGLEA